MTDRSVPPPNILIKTGAPSSTIDESFSNAYKADNSKEREEELSLPSMALSNNGCLKFVMIGNPQDKRNLTLEDFQRVVRSLFDVNHFEFRNKKLDVTIPNDCLLRYIAQCHDVSNLVIEIVKFAKPYESVKEGIDNNSTIPRENNDNKHDGSFAKLSNTCHTEDPQVKVKSLTKLLHSSKFLRKIDIGDHEKSSEALPATGICNGLLKPKNTVGIFSIPGVTPPKGVFSSRKRNPVNKKKGNPLKRLVIAAAIINISKFSSMVARCCQSLERLLIFAAISCMGDAIVMGVSEDDPYGFGSSTTSTTKFFTSLHCAT
uniref:Uncharacterized protein n=1 Tax=Glossina austeni TaxID=7395 RepID=A0A1A9VGN3_GLOAU